MLRVITVEPVADGWALDTGAAGPLIFDDGAQAVWSARKVGEALAEGGVPAEIRIRDREGILAGQFLCSPPPRLKLVG